MPGPELSLIDRQLAEILTPLNVGVDGIVGKPSHVFGRTEGMPNLTRRLTDKLSDHSGKFLTATGVIGAGLLSYHIFNSLRNLDNSWPNIALNAAVLTFSIAGGGLAGLTGGCVGGLAIALISEQVEKMEDIIRRRFNNV